MKMTHRHEGEAQVIAIAEELGHHEAHQIIDYMDAVLTMHPDGSVILDLAELSFMDSSGLAVVLHAHKLTQRTGRGLSVRGVREQAMRVFRAAGIPKIIHFERE